ncbi:hypothetical protein AB4Y96_09050 [Phyllobacterium sp. TAF24]|uniref:hypothetical protein n=1 Tax=Phyllobacterium sp. TAF24 TaxID=3233068 RepID=UPI003F9A6C75
MSAQRQTEQPEKVTAYAEGWALYRARCAFRGLLKIYGIGGARALMDQIISDEEGKKQ